MSMSCFRVHKGSAGTIKVPTLSSVRPPSPCDISKHSNASTLKRQVENPYAVFQLKVSSTEHEISNSEQREESESQQPSQFQLDLQKRLQNLKKMDMETNFVTNGDSTGDDEMPRPLKVKYDKNRNNAFFTLPHRRKLSEGSNSVRIMRPSWRKTSDGHYADNFTHFRRTAISMYEDGADDDNVDDGNVDEPYEIPEVEEAERRRQSYMKASQSSSDRDEVYSQSSHSGYGGHATRSGLLSDEADPSSHSLEGSFYSSEDSGEAGYQYQPEFRGQVLMALDHMFVCVEPYDPVDPAGLQLDIGDVVTGANIM